MTTTLTIAILGGTGAQGQGLGARFAVSGHTTLLGSRYPDRARAAAKQVAALLPTEAQALVGWGSNLEVAAAADVILIATPWDPSPTSFQWLASLAEGKVVISCVNPLGFDRNGPFGLDVAAGSAAEHIAGQLPGAHVAGAFHHVAAGRLANLNLSLHDEDVLVASDDARALEVACDLARSVSGRGGIDAGRLRMCRQLEPWTATLIAINKNYQTHSGIALRNVVHTRSTRFTVA